MAGNRIALVEDEARVRVALARLLRLANYEVSAYASGEEFLKGLTESIPGCLILDVHLPGLSGIEVQRQLRSGRVQVPVVFITASDDPSLDREASESGGLRLLRKPFSGDELLAAVASALNWPAGVRH
jgi:FixJ family two-component response regulator